MTWQQGYSRGNGLYCLLFTLYSLVFALSPSLSLEAPAGRLGTLRYLDPEQKVSSAHSATESESVHHWKSVGEATARRRWRRRWWRRWWRR